MNKVYLRFFTRTALTLSALTLSAQAEIIDRGNGMFYDSDQNLTWLQDANYAKTSGYRCDSCVPFPVLGSQWAGTMSWDDANTWAENLEYGGYSDWRLPSIKKLEEGYNPDTSGSELAYMWYTILGNSLEAETFEPGYSPDPNKIGPMTPKCGLGGPENHPYCLRSTSADGVDVLNFEPWGYWTNIEDQGDVTQAWGFMSRMGEQKVGPKTIPLNAWAVRSGDVEPH